MLNDLFAVPVYEIRVDLYKVPTVLVGVHQGSACDKMHVPESPAEIG